MSDPDQLAAAGTVVRSLMAEVDIAVSRFRSDSHLERVNRHAGRLVPVNPLAFHLVTVALDAARATDGAVDPTIGADLIRLGYDQDIAEVRRSGTAGPEAGRMAPRPSWRGVVLDRQWRRVGVPEGVRLDLGATAKAWTADEAARRIHRGLGGAVLVGIGGDLASAGSAPRDWRVDVAESEGGPAARIGLHEGGVATSSVVERRWTGADGTERHHVIDPRTGLPARSVWRTTTVWAPTALGANVMSTWALVDPAAAVPSLLERGLAARFVHHSGRVATFGSWPADAGTEVA
jgi:thiamine biosynthesis lipoprotein